MEEEKYEFVLDEFLTRYEEESLSALHDMRFARNAEDFTIAEQSHAWNDEHLNDRKAMLRKAGYIVLYDECTREYWVNM